jgi:hypothetical protein
MRSADAVPAGLRQAATNPAVSLRSSSTPSKYRSPIDRVRQVVARELRSSGAPTSTAATAAAARMRRRTQSHPEASGTDDSYVPFRLFHQASPYSRWSPSPARRLVAVEVLMASARLHSGQ